MIGYVRADKKSMKMADYEIYRGIYCTLCNALGKNYSVFARLLLSYDFALAAILKLAVSADSCEFKKKSCPFNPSKKCWCCNGRAEVDFCAHAVIIISYYKLKDNIHDKGFGKKLLSILLYPMIALMHKKAKRLAPEVENAVSESMTKQAEAEKKADCSIDEAADPSAVALGKIFAVGYEGETADLMYHLGYMTGRYVYILDAADDLEKDIKSGNFNPFKKEFPSIESEEEKQNFLSVAEGSLNMTQAQLLEYKDKLNLNRFGSIIENILFYGIDGSARKMINRYKGVKEEKKVFTVK